MTRVCGGLEQQIWLSRDMWRSGTSEYLAEYHDRDHEYLSHPIDQYLALMCAIIGKSPSSQLMN